MRRWCLLISLASACGPDPIETDPLAPDVLDDLGKQQGDATGTAWSGWYLLDMDRSDCDCPTFEFEQEMVAVCDLDDLAKSEDEVTVEVRQADGQLVMMAEDDLQLTGSVDADGTFVLTAVRNEAVPVGTLQSLSRVEGRLTRPDAPQFQADYWQRFSGELGNEPVDCRTRYDVAGARIDDSDE